MKSSAEWRRAGFRSRRCNGRLRSRIRLWKIVRRTSSALRVLKNVSTMALSKQFPLPDIEIEMPFFLSSAWCSTEPYWLPRTPFCLSSGNLGGVDFSAALSDEREDLSGEVTLQGSNGVEFGMPFRDPTSNIVLGSLI